MEQEISVKPEPLKPFLLTKARTTQFKKSKDPEYNQEIINTKIPRGLPRYLSGKV